ncbi:DMT family transporter [Lonepinella koalarum]|uniref:DMT family transporter n=1 Tax=Lonepinella koalarum TaxID=53417 RepID=UPI0011E49F30|nr:DMT family transporter [Lonepinella koalarum]TYG34665.1 DMT family transporter [Lonepinella koalarum]
MLYILLGISAGFGIALQTVFNTRLRTVLHSPLLASMVSFGVACLIIFALLLGNDGLGLHIPTNTPFWVWLGGVFGVVGLTTTIILFPHLGGVQTSLMIILGQVLMGLLIDHFAWFGSQEYALAFSRMCGTLLVLVGSFAVIALPALKTGVFSQIQAQGLWLWRLFGILAGMSVASQSAINGQLGQLLGSPLQATLVSLIASLLALGAWISLKNLQEWGNFRQLRHVKLPLWAWCGGVMGALFVASNTLLVPHIGTGQTVLFGLFGMLLGSVCVDQFGWFGASKKPLIIGQLVGLVTVFVGVGIIRLA